MISTAYVFIGDHSGSNSEKWNMAVGGRTHSASDFGDVQRDKRDFKKGESYPVSVTHAGTNRDPDDGPDFDYRAWVDRYANPSWSSGSAVPNGSEFFATDAQSLFQRRHFGSDTDATIGKTATLHFPAIDLDIDSDGSGAINGSVSEDNLETDSKKGLFFPVHSGDADADGVADNYDFNGIAGLSFTPIKLELSSNLSHVGGQVNLTFDYDGAGMSASDNGLFRIWKKDASQSRTASDLLSDGSSVSASSIGLTPGSTVTLYLEAVNPTRRTVNLDPISVEAVISGSSVWNGSLDDKVHASGIEIDIDAMKVSHNAASGELDDNLEETDGAFLPVNSDDDDYDASNTPDKDQTGAIQGENDLLPVVLRKVRRGGSFTLEIPSHVKVYSDN